MESDRIHSDACVYNFHDHYYEVLCCTAGIAAQLNSIFFKVIMTVMMCIIITASILFITVISIISMILILSSISLIIVTLMLIKTQSIS